MENWRQWRGSPWAEYNDLGFCEKPVKSPCDIRSETALFANEAAVLLSKRPLGICCRFTDYKHTINALVARTLAGIRRAFRHEVAGPIARSAA